MGLFNFISGVADTMNVMKARPLVDELRRSIMPYDNTWSATESFVNSMRKKKASGTKLMMQKCQHCVLLQNSR